MNSDGSFVDETVDRLQTIGPVRAKRMFGGYGLFVNDRMFALIADNELYLKADNLSSHHFSTMELPQFSYTKSNNKTYYLSYYLVLIFKE